MGIIDEIIAAKEAIDKLGKAATEYRIHPDDYDDLREACRDFLNYPARGAANNFNGLKIILDHNAPRLPRIATD